MDNINEIDQDLLEFYQKYGILLLKFCTYHNYIFLESDEENSFDKKEQNENEDDRINNTNNDIFDDNIKVIFLMDKMSKDNGNEIKRGFHGFTKKEKIQKVLINKRYKSSLGTKQYYELILRAIKHYLNHVVKNIKSHPGIKPLKENLCYFMDSFEIESYFPLYFNHLNKMIINDNFTKSFVTNVFPGEANKLYFDVFFKEDVLIYFEFYLEDKTKDLNFELNIYDHNKNSFKPLWANDFIIYEL